MRNAPIRARHAVANSRTEARLETQNWKRRCLAFVREMWELPPVNPTARAAWENANDRVKWTGDTEDIPYGAPVFSKRPGSDPDDPWHVFICGGHDARGKRIFRSVDIATLGGVDAVHIEAFTEKWGHRILGYTRDLNGYALNLPPSPNERKRSR